MHRLRFFIAATFMGILSLGMAMSTAHAVPTTVVVDDGAGFAGSFTVDVTGSGNDIFNATTFSFTHTPTGGSWSSAGGTTITFDVFTDTLAAPELAFGITEDLTGLQLDVTFFFTPGATFSGLISGTGTGTSSNFTSTSITGSTVSVSGAGSAVPEPAAASLLGLGLLGLIARRRRQKA